MSATNTGTDTKTERARAVEHNAIATTTPAATVAIVPERDIPGWGVDLSHAARPGVPMENLPPRAAGHAHWATPEAQPASVTVFKSVGLERMPPLFGTAQPPKGLSGMIRAAAYSIPDHEVKHWLTLLLADRVDIVEHRVKPLVPWLPVIVPVAAGAFILAMRPRRRARFRLFG